MNACLQTRPSHVFYSLSRFLRRDPYPAAGKALEASPSLQRQVPSSAQGEVCSASSYRGPRDGDQPRTRHGGGGGTRRPWDSCLPNLQPSGQPLGRPHTRAQFTCQGSSASAMPATADPLRATVMHRPSERAPPPACVEALLGVQCLLATASSPSARGGLWKPQRGSLDGGGAGE